MLSRTSQMHFVHTGAPRTSHYAHGSQLQGWDLAWWCTLAYFDASRSHVRWCELKRHNCVTVVCVQVFASWCLPIYWLNSWTKSVMQEVLQWPLSSTTLISTQCQYFQLFCFEFRLYFIYLTCQHFYFVSLLCLWSCFPISGIISHHMHLWQLCRM